MAAPPPAQKPKPKPNPLPAAVFLFLLHYAAASDNHPDTQPLLTFKSTADPNGAVLTTWNSSSDPCSTTAAAWVGVSCLRNRVVRLVLENSNLQGPFPTSLTSLTQLRVLSLKQNGFSGPIPDLSALTSLKLLFLSHNRFSGGLPNSLSSLSKLYRLDLSYNNFSGSVPLPVNRLTHLLTLRLEENGFAGPISGLNLPNLQDFNVSGNGFTGQIPGSLSGFPGSSFWSNPGLCGPPLEKCKTVSTNPTQPGGGAMASPLSPTVSSSPTAIPAETNPPGKSGSSHRSKISSIAIIGIIVGDVLVLGLVSLLLYCYFWKNYSSKLTKPGKSSGSSQVEKIVYSSSPYPNPTQSGYERGKMVFFDGERRFELEDLLRASAEMLGKGGFGTAYKAILDDGNVVAVKRLKDLNVNGKREFEQQMEVLGRLRHPNLVGLKAYYFARDEKLLVHDYMPNGNLFWLLHGNRGPGRTPLDWTTRLKTAAGAARGLAFIHKSSPPLKLVHGNIKSTNVLIDKSGTAKLSDYGRSMFATSASSSAPKSNGYRAPEAALDGKKLTQKSDVYSFGVLLLELLTGKCPSIVDSAGPGLGYSGVVDLPRWVQSVVREEWTAEVFDLELMRYKDIEEEMVGLLQIGMACTQSSPEQRPKMNYVVKMIEELRGVEVSPSHENLDSVSDSPSVLSEDTCRASE
ncbi:PREDICTED: probable leucine-rich repeat receptor-like protein kinase At1g68400 [Erythranthe guttata]|nr:PREDICTED: probable leucine-rich repeat receptor-like protein kinase At1g68400 [Erythranthe guttata]|eukprot:XP_012833342.1 PREDICTED: probable leucine-rich repeat receptor-like protein kinase At1g68400 [Erythranthe guttata]